MSFPSSAARRWLPILLWMGVIFLASTDIGSAAHTGSIVLGFLRWISSGQLSLARMEEIHFLIRKTAHLTEYAILGALLWRAFSAPALEDTRTSPFVRKWSVAAAIVVSALYASSDEYHQSFVPGRTASPRDVLIDTVGATLGVTAIYLLNRRVRQSGAKRPVPDTA